MTIKKKIFVALIIGMMLVAPFSVYASEAWETPSGLDAKQFETYCDTYFEDKVKEEIPGASIVVISDGKIVFEKGYGYSDIAAHKGSDPASTIYEYGSVSKLFTWVSLMRLYEPGYASSYSNYGAGLAGYIVENVVHKPEYEYIKENIMAPCGMEKAVINPDIFSDQTLLFNKAKVYSKEGDGFKDQNWSIVSMYPAGGANGTVEELGKFAIALLDKEKHPLFTNGEMIETLLTTSTHSAEGVAGIAHGFIEYDGEGKTYWHNGGTDHSSTSCS